MSFIFKLTFLHKQKKMHPFLLMLEITWLVYFVGVTIASYCISDGSLLARAVRRSVGGQPDPGRG